MRLENKKALVTGASRGIGKAVAERFIAEGAEVWGLSNREPDDLKERIDKAGGKLHWIAIDLRKLGEVEGVIETAIREAHGFDVLVNNAGITRDNLSFRMSLEEWQ
ncbi:MAG: SDR family NAD(P)-dependent oxidoreductase, partial [Treponema sp.]|nr:SDR family NAD(P)-dependent oxidoreductase [Treponema sp.]